MPVAGSVRPHCAWYNCIHSDRASAHIMPACGIPMYGDFCLTTGQMTISQRAARRVFVCMFTLMTGRWALAQSAPPHDVYLGTYMGSQKIGHTSEHTAPTVYQGAPADKTVTHGVTRLTMLGATVEQVEDSTTITGKNGAPLWQSMHVQSNGSAIHVEAAFDYAHHVINCLVGTGADQKRRAEKFLGKWPR